jgi:two-component system alkaline phosphatase synthesis response regulator PhoP
MPRLLIADDQDPIRQMVRITLATQGWDIVEATNGSQALALAKAERPDLALLDVDMGPGPTGFDVCRALKSEDTTMHMPVVLLTAFDNEADRAKGFAAGADRYLTKPFSPLSLIDTIRAIIAPK